MDESRNKLIYRVMMFYYKKYGDSLIRYNFIDSKIHDYKLGEVIRYSKENHELSNGCIIKSIINKKIGDKIVLDYLLLSHVNNNLQKLWKIYPQNHWIFLLDPKTKGNNGREKRDKKRAIYAININENCNNNLPIDYDKAGLTEKEKKICTEIDDMINKNKKYVSRK